MELAMIARCPHGLASFSVLVPPNGQLKLRRLKVVEIPGWRDRDHHRIISLSCDAAA
jgi:hypothetical protein